MNTVNISLSPKTLLQLTHATVTVQRAFRRYKRRKLRQPISKQDQPPAQLKDDQVLDTILNWLGYHDAVLSPPHSAVHSRPSTPPQTVSTTATIAGTTPEPTTSGLAGLESLFFTSVGAATSLEKSKKSYEIGRQQVEQTAGRPLDHLQRIETTKQIGRTLDVLNIMQTPDGTVKSSR